MSEVKATVTLTINGKETTVPKGTTVYTAAKELGFQIPIFCYQDRMPPFGACRACLVEVEKMGKLQTSCTLEAVEGMVVKTESALAKEGQSSILEFLLINHPLDCPICDRAGECPLQDQAVRFGPGISRFFEEKRRFKKPIPLGPVLMLDRERCVVCARCTRFGDIVAGDHALEFIDRGYKTEVGTPDGKSLESKFIGNTIHICPVGALTSQVYRFVARPWDNVSTESSCTLCPVGCSMILDARDGEMARTRPSENRDVNDIWLCDKGSFGYEFTSSAARLKTPLIRKKGKLESASWDEALQLVADRFKEAKQSKKIAALGGNPLTVEENYLYQKLIREGASVNNVDHRVGEPLFSLNEEGIAPGMEMAIGECSSLSFVFLFGVDLTEEFPVIWLRLKSAINQGAVAIFVGHYAPEISSHLTEVHLHAPGDEQSEIAKQLPKLSELVKSGKKGALFVGSQYLRSENRGALLQKLAAFREGHSNLTLNLLEGRGNCFGARFAGMRPDLGPLGKLIKTPGLTAVEVMNESATSGWDFLYVAGANPVRHTQAKLWKRARENLKFLVVQDLFLTETAQEADVLLPTLSFLEKEGSFMNIEGRISSLRIGKAIPEGLLSDGEIFTEIAKRLGIDLSLDSHFKDQLKPGRILEKQKPFFTETVSSKRGEGLYATFSHALFDEGVRMQENRHLIKLAKEPKALLHPREGKKRGLKEGQVVNLFAEGQSVSAKIGFDSKVALQTIVLPLGFTKLPLQEFGMNLMNGMEVEIHG